MIPTAKKFETIAVKNAESKIYPDELIIEAVKRRKLFDREKDHQCHVEPMLYIDKNFVKLPKTLQYLLAPHPFPLSQGPLMLPLDLEINPSATVDQILASKTVFAHSGDQSYVVFGFQMFLVLLPGQLRIRLPSMIRERLAL